MTNIEELYLNIKTKHKNKYQKFSTELRWEEKNTLPHHQCLQLKRGTEKFKMRNDTEIPASESFSDPSILRGKSVK